MANLLLVCFDNQAYGPNIRVLAAVVNRSSAHRAYQLFFHKPSPTYHQPFGETPAELNDFTRLLDELDIDVVGLTLMTHEYGRAVEPVATF